VIRAHEKPATVLAMINRRHRLALSLDDAAPGDTRAAWRVTDPAGRAMLMKWSAGSEFPPADAAALASRLRAAGYPIQEFSCWGTDGAISYTVRPWVEGRVLGPGLRRHLEQVLALVEMHEGAAPTPGGGLRDQLIASVLDGFSDWCVLDSMRKHPRGAKILERVQAIARGSERVEIRTADAVHFDFHHFNILVDDAGIVSVIDWEGCRAGDRAFDLATLLYYSYPDPALREALWERANAIASHGAIALFLAHLIVRQTEWSIRLETEEAADRYLRIADLILADLDARALAAFSLAQPRPAILSGFRQSRIRDSSRAPDTRAGMTK
jgi:fructosamine-3-kinase